MLRASAKRDNKLESSDALRRSNKRGAAYGSPRDFWLSLSGRRRDAWRRCAWRRLRRPSARP
jgi:hypothetical protein